MHSMRRTIIGGAIFVSRNIRNASSTLAEHSIRGFQPESSVFSVSIPVSDRLSGFARQVSLEMSNCPFSPAHPAVTAPWIIVEYVKFGIGGAKARSIHETHLAGAFEAALGLYGSLGLDLPVFGILINRWDATVYVASAVKDEVSDTPNSSHPAPFYMKMSNLTSAF